MKLFLIILSIFLLSSCELINDLFSTNTGSDFLVIGDIQDDSYIQKKFDPPFIHQDYREPFDLDVDGDSVMDFRFRTIEDYHHGFNGYSSSVEVLNQEFRVAIKTYTDTVYRCFYLTSDGDHYNLNTNRDSLRCPADGEFSIKEVLSVDLVNCLELHNTLTNDLVWKDGINDILLITDTWQYNNLEHTSSSHIRQGGLFDELDHYIGIRKKATEGYFYGYLKMRFIGGYEDPELYEIFLDQ